MNREVKYRNVYDENFGFEPYRKGDCWFFERHIILTPEGNSFANAGWLVFEVLDVCCSKHSRHFDRTGILEIDQSKTDNNLNHIFMILCNENCPKNTAEYYSAMALMEFMFKSELGRKRFPKLIQEMKSDGRLES